MLSNKITAIITDLDGCLWAGVIAEKQSVHLNENYFSRLKELYNKGIQLFVVSKNDHKDVMDTFYAIGVNSKLFTGIIANWEPKYLNIEKLLYQTKIRPETVIFIDDNLFELNEVSKKIPSINCLNFSEWISALNNDYFRGLRQQVSSEIQERINRYKTAMASSRLKDFIKEDEVFLKLLKRKMAMAEIESSDDIKRFANLLSLTHRINFNPEKFQDPNEALRNLTERKKQGEVLYGVSVWENNLPLGLSGGFVVKLGGEAAHIEDATFSCGIMGRDFEQKSIVELINSLKKSGINRVTFSITQTSTNLRVNEILNELEFQKSNTIKGKTLYSLNLSNYYPVKNYDWIEVLDNPIFSEHLGVSSIINFLDNTALPLIRPGIKIINLGAGRGEVIGHLQPEKRKRFNEFLKQNEVSYCKVDLEELPGENNIVGDAENLRDIVPDESNNLVMAIELLEHTEHFWKVIDEMIRICKVGGYILITVPAFNYPKHEYPIDLWRIGPVTMKSFFPNDKFEIIKFEKEGDQKFPRRLLLLVQKKKSFATQHNIPNGGKTDWKTGITIFK